METPKLRALLIGINDYRIEEKNLKGCLNDVQLIKEVIAEQVDKDIDKKILIIPEEKATYKHVIDTFLDFFSDLEDGDQALFYYSGHGSRMNAPPEFRYETFDEKIETLVLYDSRHEAKRDLADKELAYLVWKVSHQKNVTFTSILDSCYSGGLLRNDEVRVRHDPNPNEDRTWQDFFGSEDYEKRDGKVYIPKSNHVVLSACRKDELAKEYKLGGQPHGLFTFNFAKIFRRSNGKLSLAEVLHRLKASMHGFTTEQHPQLQKHEWLDIDDRIFLPGVLKQKPDTHILFYNFQQERDMPVGWLIDAGRVHGLDPSYQADNKIQLRITSPLPEAVNDLVEIKEIGHSYSTVNAPYGLKSIIGNDEILHYDVVFKTFPAMPMAFGFHPYECDPEAKELILNSWQKHPSIYLNFTKEWHEAKYLIHAKEDKYWLRARGEETNYLFDKLEGFTVANASQVLVNLEKIAKWHRTKEMQNPKSSITKKDVKLSFYEIEEIPRVHGVKKMEIITPGFLIEEPILKYYTQGNDYPDIDACFKIKIENKRDEPLWVSVLFIGSDYSIANDYLDKYKLGPGTALVINKGKPIKLFIEDYYINKGISKIIEYFKIIISTDEFETNHLNQQGIPYDSKAKGSLMRSKQDEKKLQFQSDWVSFDFSVCIKHETK